MKRGQRVVHGGKELFENSVAMIRVHAAPPVDFKNCCMLTGEFDGSDRHHFFQGVTCQRDWLHTADWA